MGGNDRWHRALWGQSPHAEKPGDFETADAGGIQPVNVWFG
jgi:hypothetical protein